MPIHVIRTPQGIEVWTDCEKDTLRDGRLIGQGSTLRDATWDAVEELTKDLTQLTKPLEIIEEK